MEVLLHAGRANPVSELLRRFRFVSLTDANSSTDPTGAIAMYGKAVLYAKHPIELNADAIAKLQGIEGLADLPYQPQRIEAGHPIVTVRAGLPVASAGELVAGRGKSSKLRLLEALRLQAEKVWDAIAPKS